MATKYIIDNLAEQTISGSLSAITISADTLYVSGNSVSKPYKVYTALLTQTGSTAPEAIVLENTLGGDVVWLYNDVGDYLLSGDTLFSTEDKFFTFDQFKQISDTDYIEVYHLNSNIISVNTNYWNGINPPIFQPIDDLLFAYPFEIRVYN